MKTTQPENKDPFELFLEVLRKGAEIVNERQPGNPRGPFNQVRKILEAGAKHLQLDPGLFGKLLRGEIKIENFERKMKMKKHIVFKRLKDGVTFGDIFISWGDLCPEHKDFVLEHKWDAAPAKEAVKAWEDENNVRLIFDHGAICKFCKHENLFHVHYPIDICEKCGEPIWGYRFTKNAKVWIDGKGALIHQWFQMGDAGQKFLLRFKLQEGKYEGNFICIITREANGVFVSYSRSKEGESILMGSAHRPLKQLFLQKISDWGWKQELKDVSPSNSPILYEEFERRWNEKKEFDQVTNLALSS